MTIDAFNEMAQYVRVLWNRDRGVYQVIGIDGRLLFKSSSARRCLHIAERFEGDYAAMVTADKAANHASQPIGGRASTRGTAMSERESLPAARQIEAIDVLIEHMTDAELSEFVTRIRVKVRDEKRKILTWPEAEAVSSLKKERERRLGY